MYHYRIYATSVDFSIVARLNLVPYHIVKLIALSHDITIELKGKGKLLMFISNEKFVLGPIIIIEALCQSYHSKHPFPCMQIEIVIIY